MVTVSLSKLELLSLALTSLYVIGPNEKKKKTSYDLELFLK